jgi:hypothetical protein
MKPSLTPPGTKRLKLKADEPPAILAFKINLRRYNKGKKQAKAAKESWFAKVWRCRLAASHPVLIARMVSALEARM